MTCNDFDCTEVVNGKCPHTKDGYCGAGCEKYKNCKFCKNKDNKSKLVCEFSGLW